MKTTINFPLLFLSSLVITITGCNFLNFGLAFPKSVEIANIRNKDFVDNSLKTEGKVTKIIPLVNSHAYLLEDEAESIWVITSSPAPQEGQQLIVEGLLKKEVIVFEEEEASEFYLEETQRFLPESPPDGDDENEEESTTENQS